MSPDLAYLDDQKFAAIMIDDDGVKEAEWVVLSGIAKWRDGQLFIHRGMDIPEFPIPETAWDRIKPVSPEVKHILFDSDYSVTLSVGPLPPDDDPSAYGHTGFRWPDKADGVKGD
jgi:hypothetical protein